MSYYEFSVFLAENVDTYIKCLLFSVLIYSVILYRHSLSIFEPLTFVFLGSMFGFSVILLLHQTDQISQYYFFQYLFSQIAFFIGFLCFKVTKNNIIQRDANIETPSGNQLFYWYLIISSCFIIMNLVIYKVSGIPLFSEYRLAVGTGGGLGLLKRVLRIVTPASCYLSFYFLFSSKQRYRFCAIIVLLFHCIVTILSGSKSAFFSILQLFFLYCILNRNTSGRVLAIFKKYQLYIILIAVFMSILTIIIQGNMAFLESFAALLFRFVSFGDTYYMAYPSALIEYLSKADFITVFFGDLLRTIRIFTEDMAPPGIGFELYNLANKSVDAFAGPNPRHNIYGYVNFGFWGGILFSLGCGLILSFTRRSLFSTNLNITQDRKILILLCYLSVVSVETDPPSTIMYLNNIILIYPILLLINNLLTCLSKKRI